MIGNRSKFLASTLILLALLCYAYSDIIVDAYRFIGFEYEIRLDAVIYSILSLIIIAAILPKSEASIINFLAIFLVMTVFVPMQILCFAGGKSLLFLTQIFACISLIIFSARITNFSFSIKKKLRPQTLVMLC